MFSKVCYDHFKKLISKSLLQKTSFRMHHENLVNLVLERLYENFILEIMC